ncbi:MAG: fatty acid desaturase family protein [Pseudomonadales bacterium]|nr:fatty acid desaturase family protein [Pseudomonadales bacterium]
MKDFTEPEFSIDHSFLTKEERALLREKSDLKAVWSFIEVWGLTAVIFFVMAQFPYWFVILPGIFLLAGRQLAMGALLHDCSHRCMFTSAKVNDFMGNWFGGIPNLVSVEFYRPYHFTHHTKAGTKEDPDLKNIEQYPVSKSSMARKFIRDFSGLSGLKTLAALLFMVNAGRSGDAVAMGVNKLEEQSKKEMIFSTLKNYFRILVFHGSFFTVLHLLGHAWLYACWWAAFIFVYPWVMRVRQMSEHAALPKFEDKNCRLMTRSTVPTATNLFERLIFCGNNVNLHLEHHYLSTVPGYNLPKMHKLLDERGFFKGAEYSRESSYFDVIRRACA